MKRATRRTTTTITRDLLAEVIATPLRPAARLDGVVIGRVTGFGADGAPLVDFPQATAPLAARATLALGPDAVGRQAALLFEGGNPERPIVVGLLHEPAPVAAAVDGERLVLRAEREIVLECGDASITLTRAGKVLIRGTYVLSRSSGTNRIKGGSVEIN